MAAVDHGISWALYFSDPDGHRVELYLDRGTRADGTARWRGGNPFLPEAKRRGESSERQA